MQNDIPDRITTLTFDCYGTLVDWRAGQRDCFRRIFHTDDENRLDELGLAYEETEARVQAELFRSYREVLAEVVKRLAGRFGLDLPPDRANDLATSLPTWPAFGDTVAALNRLQRRYRLGVLSNVDRDLFMETSRHLGVVFDFVVTAEDVQAYKPSHAHFQAAFSKHAPRDEILHVAQSLFHDGRPAASLDLAYVWINRYNDTNTTEVRPLAVYPDLKSLADALARGEPS